MTLFSTEPRRHKVPDLSSQFWPNTHWKEDNSPSQYETIDILLSMIHNYTGSSPILPSLPTTKINPKGHLSTFPPSQIHIHVMLLTNTVHNNEWHLHDHYATLSLPTHTSTLAHSLWQRWLNTLRRRFHQSKAYLYVFDVLYFMVLNTASHPHFFCLTEIKYIKPCGFCQKRWMH